MVGGISLGVYHKLILARGTVEVQGAVIGLDLGIAAVNGCGRRHAIGRRGVALYSVAGVAVVTAHIFHRTRRIDAVGQHRVVVGVKGGDSAHRAEQVVRAVNAARSRGIVFSGFDDVGVVLGSIRSGKMPVVLANGTLALPDAYSVMVDDCRGVEMAVEHLVKTGRRNLYYIKDKSTDSAAAKAKGFLSGMAAAGLDADGHVLETGETLEDGIRVVQQLLAEGIRPDGILCGEDLTAAGVLKALLRAGIRVPEETAVVGYDNSTYARLCEPELTSVDNKPEQVALLCVQLLQSRIEHGEDYSSVTLQPELVQRQSS